MSNTATGRIINAVDQAKEEIRNKTRADSSGLIVSSKDGIVVIQNLTNVSLGELVKVQENNATGLVLQLETNLVYAAILEGGESVRPGNTVVATGQVASIGVSEAILGRVVDPLGNGLDGLGSVPTEKQMKLEQLAPSVMDRQPVSTPLQTGILAIDALIPIGRGQRELIIGDRQTGKTTIALDTIINQKGQDMVCVYVAIGQRDGKLAQVIKTLRDAGALRYTTVVSASSSQSAALQYLAPYAGCAIAEYFLAQGKDVLVVYDDLSKHAVAYRELSLLLRKPPGREAYPGDVFYIHSRLLERAARLSQEKGGGSITALPIVETQAADVSAYIPTNIISITDGQIFLEPKLFYKGIRPAINVGISVSRVGGNAQTKIMKKVAGPTKLFLSQYADLAAFAQFASELDEESKKQLSRGERLTEVLKQKAGSPLGLWEEVLLLYAATNGYFDQLPVNRVAEESTRLLNQAKTDLQKEIQQITNTPEMTAELEASLKNFLASANA